jgi:diadenosine tetraphosphatase ApaH/serine/threonine PP2A family protein phosphatase
MVDGDCEFVHASLNRPEDWTYLVRGEGTSRTLQGADAPNLFRRAHSCSVCVELPTDGKILINVGSVGQPRDLCPDACYAICDPQAGWVEFRRVHYDVVKTRRKISRAKLPAFAAQRLSLGR